MDAAKIRHKNEMDSAVQLLEKPLNTVILGLGHLPIRL